MWDLSSLIFRDQTMSPVEARSLNQTTREVPKYTFLTIIQVNHFHTYCIIPLSVIGQLHKVYLLAVKKFFTHVITTAI